MPPVPPSAADAPPQRLCASADLIERGRAHGFELTWNGQTVPAFALRFEGQVVAYLNRCAHVPVEMDWQPGQFLDQDGRWIVCAIHGAAYEPADGHCVAGPCAGRRLQAVRVMEHDGTVFWWPQTPLAKPTRSESPPATRPVPTCVAPPPEALP